MRLRLAALVRSTCLAAALACASCDDDGVGETCKATKDCSYGLVCDPRDNTCKRPADVRRARDGGSPDGRTDTGDAAVDAAGVDAPVDAPAPSDGPAGTPPAGDAGADAALPAVIDAPATLPLDALSLPDAT